MKSIWIFLIFTLAASATSLNSDKDGWYDDYWYDDDTEKLPQENVKDKSTSTASDENDSISQEELLDWLNRLTTGAETETTKGNFDEYQFEDNRSEVNEDNLENIKSTISDRTENNDITKTTPNSENKSQTSKLSTSDTDINTSNAKETTKLSTKIFSDENIFEMTRDILNEDTDNDFSDIKPALEKQFTNGIEKIVEETNKIVYNDKSESIHDDPSTELNNDKGKDDEQESSQITVSAESREISEEDPVDKAFTDLMSDLDNLQETWDKLQDSKDENENDFKIGEDTKTEKLSSLEDDDYEEIIDSNLDKLFEDNESDENFDESDEEESDNEVVEVESTTAKTNQPIQYLNDALIASEPENKDTIVDKTMTSTSISMSSNEPEQEPVLMSTTSKFDDDLSRAEVDKLMEEFTTNNLNLMQISANDVRNAQQVRLSIETPVEITSPLYPQPYPTNQTVDWMFTGNGMGIELNITDFAINSHVGDYVLVKPGGVDESGSTGLLFSYRLRSPRRYRFLDVDQMFIRFEAKMGIQFLTGFKMSARMIIPRPGAPEPEPEPEALKPEPTANITLNLGGITLENFIQSEEQFRQVIADMATMYINSNGINPGLNSTLETTQITSRALCFHNWPKFERCVEVRFSVPLVYENVTEENVRLNKKDLKDMWETYSVQDPFASRLRMLGITEYQVPNDRGVLTVWLVIAAGVVLSMAMLAFAIWRFSCIANYTRMPSLSDTDSVNEKRNLDLYPTPHQTLPPLYTETDYKWADAKYDESTKVDVGGYSNRSYMHTDFYNFDSDEEVLPARDRYTTDV